MNNNCKNVEEMNSKVFESINRYYPFASKKEYALFFYEKFGELCKARLKQNKRRQEKKLAELLIIMNAFYLRFTSKEYTLDSKQLEFYLKTSIDEFGSVQEILECFSNFCSRFWQGEDKKVHFDLAFNKTASFVYMSIFAYAEKFLNGSLALCFEARNKSEKENIFL